MATKKDYYEVLGVAKTASDDEIKKAYRRLAMKHHPDRNEGNKQAEERFKEIQEAYNMLSDPQKKDAYDRFGHAGVDPSMGGGHSQAGGFDFGDIFSEIFGGGGRGAGHASYQGSDLRYSMEITLEQAAHGTKTRIQIPTFAACEACKGSGAKPGTSQSTCPTCQGTGEIRMRQGFFSMQQSCHQCHGSGKIIANPCETCKGSGHIKQRKTLEVSIPAGIDSGQSIRLSGEGEPGLRGAPAGDLYVQIHVLPHDIFVREGKELHCDVPVSFTTAALGGVVEVPTLDGRANLTIPAESQTGRVLRMRGKGIQDLRGRDTGDLYCHIIVETPINLTARQKDLLKEFDQIIQQDPQRHAPRSKTWTERLRNFFSSLGSS